MTQLLNKLIVYNMVGSAQAPDSIFATVNIYDRARETPQVQ